MRYNYYLAYIFSTINKLGELYMKKYVYSKSNMKSRKRRYTVRASEYVSDDSRELLKLKEELKKSDRLLMAEGVSEDDLEHAYYSVVGEAGRGNYGNMPYIIATADKPYDGVEEAFELMADYELKEGTAMTEEDMLKLMLDDEGTTETDYGDDLWSAVDDYADRNDFYPCGNSGVAYIDMDHAYYDNVGYYDDLTIEDFKYMWLW